MNHIVCQMSIWNFGRDGTNGTWTIDQTAPPFFNHPWSLISYVSAKTFHAAELHNNVTKVFVLIGYLSFSKKNIAWLLSLLWEMETQYKYFQFRFTIWYLLSGHVNMASYNKTPPVYYHFTVFSCLLFFGNEEIYEWDF